MFDVFTKFPTFPKSVKTGLVLLVASWSWFYISMYYFFLNQDISGKLLVVGPMICLAVLRIVNWARLLSLASNAMVIVWSAVFAVAFFQSNQIKLVASLMNIVLFGTTSYYLAIKETAIFFKTYHQPDEEDEADQQTT
jgi:hypothetical protein